MMKGSVQQARDLGLFVASLRARIGLSLETLASLVGSSKSTLCRLENGQMPLPARGKNRMLLIALALVLCSAASERDRVLSLASIDPGLLGFEELIKLGLWPPASSNTKSARLLSWEDLEQSREEVERVLRQLEAWMREPAVQQAEQASLQLRRKAARYRALLEELEQQLTRSQPDQGLNMQTDRLPLHEQSKILSAPGLFALGLGESPLANGAGRRRTICC
ncbi:MAG: helix-turn-helix domain-containing protein [Thermogemmatispora sp.]|uniref:helix-turn-helix domain-containing protein n=1 Tax=Thermogemmatispora sp. TaxID=1968838 RepID=UPI00261D3E1C|nr:helix-turn-helix transcriptional regulator [Thermogemmatispora sp.]MBX5458185.1 helix-turn-helix domain-containing protein [Thermogemmatispora sp.]